METSDNEKVVREIYEAIGRGDVAEVLARMKDTAQVMSAWSDGSG